MKKVKVILLLVLAILLIDKPIFARDQNYPIGKPGLKLTYNARIDNLPESVVQKIEIAVGAVEEFECSARTCGRLAEGAGSSLRGSGAWAAPTGQEGGARRGCRLPESMVEPPRPFRNCSPSRRIRISLPARRIAPAAIPCPGVDA